MFYVYTKNDTFQSVGTIEDYSVYRVAGSNAQWYVTKSTTFCMCCCWKGDWHLINEAVLISAGRN